MFVKVVKLAWHYRNANGWMNDRTDLQVPHTRKTSFLVKLKVRVVARCALLAQLAATFVTHAVADPARRAGELVGCGPGESLDRLVSDSRSGRVLVV